MPCLKVGQNPKISYKNICNINQGLRIYKYTVFFFIIFFLLRSCTTYNFKNFIATFNFLYYLYRATSRLIFLLIINIIFVFEAPNIIQFTNKIKGFNRVAQNLTSYNQQQTIQSNKLTILYHVLNFILTPSYPKPKQLSSKIKGYRGRVEKSAENRKESLIRLSFFYSDNKIFFLSIIASLLVTTIK